jgi:hypothetical protein
MADMAAYGEKADRDVAASVMCAALGDGSHPIGCLDLLLGCMQVLQADLDSLLDTLAKKHSTLASTWMRFVGTYRSFEQLETLRETLNQCRCSDGPPAVRNAPPILHWVNSTGRQPSIGDLVDDICTSISIVLDDKPRLSSLYRVRKHGLRWPRGMSDIIPFDRTQYWHAIGAWEYLEDTPPSNGPGNLMIALLKAYGPYWLKGLLKSSALLLWISNTVFLYEEMLTNDYVKASTVESAIDEFESLAGLLQRISEVLFDDELLWWASNVEHEEDSIAHVFDVCIRAMRIVETARKILKGDALRKKLDAMNEIDTQFSGIAGRLAASTPGLLERHVDPKPVPKGVHEAIANALRSSTDAHVSMMSYGFGSQWADRCYGPGCLKTAQEHGHRLSVCSRCKLANYCSRRCQRRGWRYPDAPHRQVCEIARNIWIQQAKYKDPAQLFVKYLRREIAPDVASKAAHNFQVLHKSQTESLR